MRDGAAPTRWTSERLSTPNFSNSGSSRKIGPIHTAGKKNRGHINGASDRKPPIEASAADGAVRGWAASGAASEADRSPRPKRTRSTRSLVTKTPGNTVAKASA